MLSEYIRTDRSIPPARKDFERAVIEQHVHEYLSQGGSIESIPFGASSEDTTPKLSRAQQVEKQREWRI